MSFVLESLGLSVNVDNKVFFEDLTEVKQFFSEGGIFVSNDSGMAHLAGASGLFTITIFTGFDPANLASERQEHIARPGTEIFLTCLFSKSIITQTMMTLDKSLCSLRKNCHWTSDGVRIISWHTWRMYI